MKDDGCGVSMIAKTRTRLLNGEGKGANRRGLLVENRVMAIPAYEAPYAETVVQSVIGFDIVSGVSCLCLVG